MMTKILTAAAPAVIALTTIACQPVATVPPPPAQTPDAVVIEGDSITWQYDHLGTASTDFPTADIHAGPGWQMEGTCKTVYTPDCQTPAQHVAEKIAAGEADVIVYALGTNDANPIWNAGWNEADEDAWLRNLAKTPRDACAVIVKPWLTEDADPAHRVEVDEARTWMDEAATLLPNVHVVDWRPYAEKPGVIQPDGIHLMTVDLTQVLAAPTVEAQAARGDVLREAVNTCAGS